MARHAEEELEKVTLNLRRGDMDYLASICRPQGIMPSVLIRRIVAAKVDILRSTEAPKELPAID